MLHLSLLLATMACRARRRLLVVALYALVSTCSRSVVAWDLGSARNATGRGCVSDVHVGRNILKERQGASKVGGVVAEQLYCWRGR